MPCSSEGLLLLREAKRLLSASRRWTRCPGVFGDQRGDGDLEPVLAGAVDDGVVPGRGAPGQAGGAVEPGGLLGAHRLAEAGPPGVGGVAQHAPDRGAVPAGLAGAGRHAQRRSASGPARRSRPRRRRSGRTARRRSPPRAPRSRSGRRRARSCGRTGSRTGRPESTLTVPALARWVLPRRVRSRIWARSYSAIMPWNCTSSASSGLSPRGPLTNTTRGAGLGELLDQQRLVGVLAGQPVRGVDQQHVHRDLADQVAQPLQRRADQARPGVPVVFEHPLLRHVQTQLLGVRAQRRGLRADRLVPPSAGPRRPGRRSLRCSSARLAS